LFSFPSLITADRVRSARLELLIAPLKSTVSSTHSSTSLLATSPPLPQLELYPAPPQQRDRCVDSAPRLQYTRSTHELTPSVHLQFSSFPPVSSSAFFRLKPLPSSYAAKRCRRHRLEPALSVASRRLVVVLPALNMDLTFSFAEKSIRISFVHLSYSRLF
jgi:hypothetical protein